MWPKADWLLLSARSAKADIGAAARMTVDDQSSSLTIGYISPLPLYAARPNRIMPPPPNCWTNSVLGTAPKHKISVPQHKAYSSLTMERPTRCLRPQLPGQSWPCSVMMGRKLAGACHPAIQSLPDARFSIFMGVRPFGNPVSGVA